VIKRHLRVSKGCATAHPLISLYRIVSVSGKRTLVEKEISFLGEDYQAIFKVSQENCEAGTPPPSQSLHTLGAPKIRREERDRLDLQKVFPILFSPKMLNIVDHTVVLHPIGSGLPKVGHSPRDSIQKLVPKM
jgi:hypothetical protein